MGETQKTVAYIGIALVLGLVAVVARPRQEATTKKDIVDKPLFEKLADPMKAAGLEVVRYVEDVGEVHTFEVAKNPTTGLWSIPSHGNYPADAQDQMKDAASSLSGLTVLDIASENQQDQQLYGVVEPNKEKLKVGDKGVGLLVSFKDEKGGNLARVIVGKQRKGTPEQRFVRIPGQDPIYVVKISTDKLSTKFEDWIEKDLLKVNAFDVERLRLKDYSIVPTAGGYGMQPRSEVTTSFNSADAKWNLDEMIIYKGSEAVKSGLLEGEELNKEKLDALKTALGEVKIVDVYRKPKGLGTTLKASGDFAKDAEARRSLEARGFILSGDNELLAANGELHALTKDGVEYVLRFGNVAGEQEGAAEGKLNRYLFITARLDESKFPKPQLAELPGEPAAPPTKPSATPDLPPTGSTEKPATAVEKPAAPAEKTDKPSEKTDKPSETNAPAGDVPPAPGSCGAGQDETKSDAATAANQDKSTEPSQLAKPADAPPADVKPAAGPAKTVAEPDNKPAITDTETKPAAASSTESPEKKTENPSNAKASDEDLLKKKLDADRDRITKDNQRKLDEWNDKQKKAQETVHELNARFADWYYVISEDVYKKLHLSRSDILKEGAKSAEEGTGVDAFRKLEKGGLKKSDPKKPESAPTFPNP